MVWKSIIFTFCLIKSWSHDQSECTNKHFLQLAGGSLRSALRERERERKRERKRETERGEGEREGERERERERCRFMFDLGLCIVERITNVLEVYYLYFLMQICSRIFSKYFPNNFSSDNCGQPVSYISFHILRNNSLQKRCSKKFTKFPEKHQCGNLFLIELRPWRLQLY